MISVFLSRIVILVFGTLYPAYASYKAVKSKNVKEYVKWMMYWIVFALFTCGETFADLFVSWIPFYYEIKIIFVLWLLSPATKGSSILYRRFVHPHFAKREQEIDSYIAQASEQGYYAFVTLGSKGLSYAANMVVQGQAKIVDQLKNYNSSDAPISGDMPVKRSSQSARDLTDGMDDDFGVEELDNKLLTEQLEREKALRRSSSMTTAAARKDVGGSVDGDDETRVIRDKVSGLTASKSSTSSTSRKEN